MKTIDIKEQPILSFGRTVKITANGIRHRLFRSLVTVGVVAVAVAFLMNTLSESLIRKSIARRTQRRTAQIRCAATWAGYLTSPGTIEEILARIGKAQSGGPAYREAATMGGLSEAEMGSYHEGATTAAAYLAFFSGLDHGRRRALVHDATGMGIFGRLEDADAADRFRKALKTMRSVRLPSSLEAFEAFLERWPKLKEQTLAIQQRRARAIAKIAEKLRGRQVIEALADADGAFGEAVREAGFALEPSTAERVAAQAKRTLEMRVLEKSVGEPEMRKAVAGYLDLLPADVDIRTLWRLLRKRGSASWYLARQKELGGAAAGLDLDRVVELAGIEAEMRALDRAERIGMVSGGLMGIGERMSWLVLAAMLVCIVGISNAMLMSVTERFREIATLKCLGALDRFIMVMFVLEACFLGVVGGIAGGVVGCLLGLGRMLLAFGSMVLPAFPIAQSLASLGTSVVLGVILAAVASVYPSFKAARLAPMEAMRIQ